MTEDKLDSLCLVETPESIDLHAELVGPIPRTLAYIIDLSIRFAVLFVLSIIISFMSDAGIGVFLLISFLLEWFYPVLFEVYNKGQTIGKRSMGLVVVNDDLTPIGWSSSLIRNLLRAADFLPFAFLAGLVTMVCNDRFQRLGDMAAGTLVIYAKTDEDKPVLTHSVSYPPPVPLELDDQIAIISFAERSSELSTARQQELADILHGLMGDKHGDRIEHLKGIGNWMLGVR